MVSFYIINPSHKLHFLSRLMLKGSKRILKGINTSSVATPSIAPSQDEEVKQRKRSKTNASSFIKSDLNSVPLEGFVRDPDYFQEDSEAGFCVFRVENTLFKVHKCYLLREPSTFQDMLSLPFVEGAADIPIPLYDTAEQFRDLLWALYAPPIEFASVPTEDSFKIERLLNIAELANKYCLVSYETWALQCILALAQNPMGFLRSAPSEVCARALNIAALTNHHELLDMVAQRLVARMLWTDVERGPILDVAESRGLRRLQGVAYYKEVIAMEQLSGFDGDETRAYFPPSVAAERRARFLAAHHSLVNLWECVRMAPPTFIDSGCTSHADCLAAWSEMWIDASSASQTMCHGQADVLGRLKTMMLLLKKSMKGPASPISMDCTLAALESITAMRDDIVAGLMDHFERY
ncbi:hypothetical protein BDN70DRAFT_458207 [Pholiota conissans]|uniref:BTB domain-containing protein n=1 Tax=Pholiota conissans TaxID=109636 RepID=A0A9P6D7G0_9AGAR|nr:hypothetical protein BDN70DRAFT_458207 [Pholiota conissans]